MTSAYKTKPASSHAKLSKQNWHKAHDSCSDLLKSEKCILDVTMEGIAIHMIPVRTPKTGTGSYSPRGTPDFLVFPKRVVGASGVGHGLWELGWSPWPTQTAIQLPKL